ncbi:MAG: hypothetical protein WD673_12315 [Alphaproteobacteria bacterium]
MEFVAYAIAFLAVAIAFGQWWTARQKLVLDLFEKRFQVYLDVRRIASEAVQIGQLSDKGSPNEVLARGRFLFGHEVVEALQTLHKLTIDLEMKNPTAAIQINEQFKTMFPLFEPYLQMTQRQPVAALIVWTKKMKTRRRR